MFKSETLNYTSVKHFHKSITITTNNFILKQLIVLLSIIFTSVQNFSNFCQLPINVAYDHVFVVGFLMQTELAGLGFWL